MASTSFKARPGGRTAKVADRVATAVRVILEADGFEALTLQTVAERASVSRATLYRRWPTRASLVHHGLIQALLETVPIADHGSFQVDLGAILQSVADFLVSRFGQAVIVAALSAEEGVEMRHRFWEARAPEVRAIFERAIARKELPLDFDYEAAFAMVAGSLYFRVIVEGERAEGGWIRRVLSLLACRHSDLETAHLNR